MVERYSGLPIPGGYSRRSSCDLLLRVEEGIRESLRYASAHPDEVMGYCRRYSQEMDEKVMRSHIDLYVNTFSLDLAREGLSAVRRLFAEAESRGIFPSSDKPLLAEEV
jgi:1,4-dihydroxy-6-naphthoate synthase